MVYSIPIRQGVKFHNGRELVADDVKFTLEHQLWPEVYSWGKSYMENLVGYDAVIELFSGTCGSLTSMDCADATLGSEPEEVVATGLNVGETYYVRVYDWYAGYPPIPTFGFCVVDGGSINLGLHDQGATLPWTIYPNPGTGAFDVLDMGLNGRVDVDVFDMTGRRIMASSFNATGSGQHHLDLGALAKGTYAVELTNSGVRTQQRLVID